MGLFQKNVWPAEFRAVISPGGNEYGGKKFFSDEERLRRHSLVQEKLKQMDCEMLIVQGYFPPSTMGVNTSLYWLGADNYYKNTFTLILPREGDMVTIHGVKTSEADWRVSPYTAGEDMEPYIRGAKRIAYDGMGFMTHQFYEYLHEICPGVEIVDMCQELAELRAVKSPEEMAAISHTCEIQDAVFRAAPLFLYPGRSFMEIYADIIRYLLLLGADPTEMFKLVIYIGDNRAVSGENLGPQFWMDPEYRIKRSDYILLTLETPGCGGYYSERSRYFFFEEPNPVFSKRFQEALKIEKYQLGIYKPGMTMQEIRESVNRFKESIGSAPELGHGWMSGEVRGIGNITVCRPLIQYEWEPLKLMKNMTIVSTHRLIKDGWNLPLHQTVWIDDDGAHIFGDYPQQITVL